MSASAVHHRFLVLVWALLVLQTGCSSSPNDSGTSGAGCMGDKDCPLGQECAGGCVPDRPTVYPNIQLASPLLRPYLDDSEADWRADNSDLIIGKTSQRADDIRSRNPNARLFEYFTIRYHLFPNEAAGWAFQNGVDDEDFYLHYREDVTLPEWAGVVIVEGFPPGVVPGWNPAWTPGDPPASATSRSQSRAIGLRAGNRPPWPLANVSNPAYRRFAAAMITGLIDGTFYNHTRAMGPIDGVVIDNAIYYPQFNEGSIDKTDEFYGVPLDDRHPYAISFETFYIELEDALNVRFGGGGADVMANYGHVLFLSRDDRFSRNVQQIVSWAWGEVWVTYLSGYAPTSGANRVITYERDYEKGMANVVRQSRSGGRRVLGARDPGDTDRGRLLTLALYYLIANRNTFYAYEAANGHLDGAPVGTWQWNPAVAVDIGKPAPIPLGAVDFDGNMGTREHYEFDSGPDPYDPTLTYHVFARNFTNGMVLAKMLPTGSVDDDRSITTHVLNRAFRMVRADGTLGPVISHVTLRNNEGVILVTP